MNKKVLIIALIAVSMLLFATLGYIIYTDLIINDSYEPILEDNDEMVVIDDKEQEDKKEEKVEEVVKSKDSSGYELQLGENRSITIPVGWMVKKLAVSSSEPPKEVQEDYNLDGVWPIYQGTELVFQKEDAEIHLVEKSFTTFYGGFGFNCRSFFPEEWIIIREPEDNGDYGVARKKEGDKWKYEVFVLGGCAGEDTVYQYRDLSGQTYVCLQGEYVDPEVADEFIIDLLEERILFNGELSL